MADQVKVLRSDLAARDAKLPNSSHSQFLLTPANPLAHFAHPSSSSSTASERARFKSACCAAVGRNSERLGLSQDLADEVTKALGRGMRVKAARHMQEMSKTAKECLSDVVDSYGIVEELSEGVDECDLTTKLCCFRSG